MPLWPLLMETSCILCCILLSGRSKPFMFFCCCVHGQYQRSVGFWTLAGTTAVSLPTLQCRWDCTHLRQDLTGYRPDFLMPRKANQHLRGRGSVLWHGFPASTSTSSMYIQSGYSSIPFSASLTLIYRISSFVGLPPHLSTSSQLEQISILCRSPSLPRTFVAETEIHRQVGRYNTQLDGMTDRKTQHSLIQLFDRDLDSIKASFQDAWTAELGIRLDAAKLYLYAFSYLTYDPSSSNISGISGIAGPFSLILQQGLFAACRLIDTFSSLAVAEQDTAPSLHVLDERFGRLLYYPKPYYTALFFAIVFLLQYLTAQPRASQADRDFAINHVTRAHYIFSQFRASREHKRAALLTEVLARLTRSGGGHSQPINTTRLGASIQYSQTFLAGQARRRNLDSHVSPPEMFEWADLGGLPPGKRCILGFQYALTVTKRQSN